MGIFAKPPTKESFAAPHLFDLRPPIPSLPRFGRLDLCLCAEPRRDVEPVALMSSDPRLPLPPMPAVPGTWPMPIPMGLTMPARGASGRRSRDRSTVAADSAAVNEGFCKVSVGSSEWRCAACARRARSWTALNLSRSSVHRISSRLLTRVPEERSKDGAVWDVLLGLMSMGGLLWGGLVPVLTWGIPVAYLRGPP